jgi:hypothetical protein
MIDQPRYDGGVTPCAQQTQRDVKCNNARDCTNGELLGSSNSAAPSELTIASAKDSGGERDQSSGATTACITVLNRVGRR